MFYLRILFYILLFFTVIRETLRTVIVGFILDPLLVFVFFGVLAFILLKDANEEKEARDRAWRIFSKYLIYSLVPIVNVWIISKICNFPLLWKILLFVPFIRFYYFYKVNLVLCKWQSLDKRYAIGMTLFPVVFYGKLIYR